MNSLRSLTYRSGLLKLTRTFGITGLLRDSYYRRLVSTDGSFEVKVNGVEVRFYAGSPRELRGIEGTFEAERDFFNFLADRLCPGDTVFDIGSNIGQFAVPMAKMVGVEGKIVAFEPEVEACRVLRRHVKLNRLTNVLVLEKALGESDSSGNLHLGGNSCPSLLSCSGGQSVSEPVEIARGDSLVRSQALPVPRAVKIDVEGYEYSVLRGLELTLANPACELLCCEIHPTFLPPGVSPRMIAEFVDSLGFSTVEENSCRQGQTHLIAKKKA